MNKLKTFVDALDHVPFVPLVGHPGARLIDKSLISCLTDADAQCAALLALYEELRPDALFAMMDLTVEAEFLGCGLKITENDPPAVAHPVLEDMERVDEVFGDKTVGGRMLLYAQVIERLKKKIDIPVCAYVIGPFTLAGEIMNLVRAMKATRKNPEGLHRVLAASSELIIRYVRLLEDAGADLICILEPSAMMIAVPQFQEYAGRYCRKIIDEGIRTMSVLHICGDTNHLIGEMEATGADGLSLDKEVSLPAIYPSLKKDTVLIGNIDPVGVVTFGEPASIQRQSRQMIDAMAGCSSYIFSTGCDVPVAAPLENLKAVMAVREG